MALDGLAKFPFPRLDSVIAIVGASRSRSAAQHYQTSE
jgi:hypothetical protein